MDYAELRKEEAEKDAGWRPLWLLFFGLLGIAARVAEYLQYRVLWLDESFTGNVIVGKSFAEFFAPLGLYQIVPPLYLTAAKICTVVGGVNEYAVRFPSLLAGLASLYVFYKAAYRILSPRAAAFAFAFFATSGMLIYYAGETKPYASDVLMSTLLWWMAVETARQPRITWKWSLQFGLLGAAALWISFPSVFVLAGIGAFQLDRCALNRDTERFTRLLAAYAAWTVSFLVLFAVVLYPGMYQPSEIEDEDLMDTMQESWSFGFMPFPPRSTTDLQAYENQFFRVFHTPGGFRLSGLAAFFAIIGWTGLFLKDNRLFWLLLNPIIIAFGASLAKLYPFDGRMILFLLPALYLVVGTGIAFFSRYMIRGAFWLTVLAMMLLLMPPTVRAARNMVAPPERHELDTALDYVDARWSDEDLLFLGHYDSLSFRFAQAWYDFPEDAVLTEARPFEMTPEGQRFFDNYPLDLLQGRKVWVVISHHYTQEDLLQLVASRGGRPVDTFEKGGARVQSFQF